MPADFLTMLASHGVLGIFAAVALWSAWQKDRALTVCQEARLADSKAATEKLLQIVGSVNVAVTQLAATSDKLYEQQKRGG